MKHRDLTRGSIWRYLLTLSVPAGLGVAMQHLYAVVDIFWIGRLGAEAVAAVTLTSLLFVVFFSIAQVIGTGTLAIVARAFGQEHPQRAVHTVRNIILFGLIVGAVCGTLGSLLAEQITTLLGGRGEVVALGGAYLRPFSIGSAFQLMALLIGFVMRGSGDMKTPMLALLVATTINAVLDPVLIFGCGPIPRLGVSGAGLATMFAQIFSAVYLALVMVSGRSLLHVPITWFRPSWTVIREALRIGLPSGLHYLALSFSFAVVLKIVAVGYGPEPISTAGIGWRLMHLTIVPVIGFGAAISTLVGQNLGAAQPQRAVRATNIGLLCGLTCVALTGTPIVTFAEPIMAFFIKSPEVIGLAQGFLRIVLVNNLLLGMIITLNCTFAGAGDNMPSMIGAIIRSTVMISMAWTCSQISGIGVNTIWLSLPVASLINLLVLFGFYRHGRWKTRMERRETEHAGT